MKFKKEHTVEFMVEQAQREADGYFEITFGGGPSEVKLTTRNHVSVTMSRTTVAGGRMTIPRITWRRGNVVVTRRAITDTLNTWRNQ